MGGQEQQGHFQTRRVFFKHKSAAGLDLDSMLNCEKLISVSKIRLTKYILSHILYITIKEKIQKRKERRGQKDVSAANCQDY